jgi:glycosyltransferase involved in cell wall biosynthesis
MRKILIVAPTFFPDTVVAAVRVSQWARHLPEFGWKPLIVCRHRGHTATHDAIAERLHPDVQVEYVGSRASAPSPTGYRETGRRAPSVRGVAMRALDVVSVPDVLVWKWRSLTAQAIEIARRWQPDVVLTSSTPHSLHSVGRLIAEATGAKWVADFRDPYLIDRRHQPLGLKRLLISVHRKFERDIYRDADLCIHAIPLHARWAARQYPFAREKIRVIFNGIPVELLDAQFLNDAPRSPRPSIRAAGVLGEGAVPIIASALRALLAEGIDAEFRHVGYARDASETIPDDLRNRLQLIGPVSHQDALREIAGADVLLKYDDRERASAHLLSSKLFEYLAMGKSIIAVNPTRPDSQFIGRLPWCWCLIDPRPAALAEAMEKAISGACKPPESWLSSFRQDYNRRNQTHQLAGWLDELTARRRGR